MSSIEQIIEKTTTTDLKSVRPRDPWTEVFTLQKEHIVVTATRSGPRFSIEVGVGLEGGKKARHINLRTTRPSASTPAMVEGNVVELVSDLVAEAVAKVNDMLQVEHERHVERMLQREESKKPFKSAPLDRMPPRSGKTARDRTKNKKA